MNFSNFYQHSLKARVTLFTLIIFLGSIWSLAFYADRMLRGDMQTLLEAQQFSTVSLLADEVDQELLTRLQALEKIAARISPAMLADPVQVQNTLEQLPIFQGLFNGGTYATGLDGSAIASLPLSVQRLGVNYLDRDYIAITLRQGKPTVGQPVMGRQLHNPIVGMAAPIRDPQGRVIGALAGLTNLGIPNFLDQFENIQYGKTGSYLLVDARHRLIVTATEKNRVMEVLPALGVNPTVDRFIQGYEGSELFVNPLGTPVLASIKHIPSAGWYAAVALPTAEAFAPMRALHLRILLATVFLTLVAAGLTWWMLGRQLAPLQATARSLATLSDRQHDLRPLPMGRQDEVGQLIRGFNRLLDDLSQRQAGLRESEERYRIAFRTSPDAISITRQADGRYLDVNSGFSRLTGWTREEAINKTAQELGIWRHPGDRQRLLAAMQKDGHCYNVEIQFVTKGGAVISTLVSANQISLGGEPCMLLITHDITERKLAQEQIERLAFSDPLTGLPNRRLFKDRLRHALNSSLRHQHHGALIFVDLDNFKILNDTLGHDTGDLLLQQVASWLSSCVRREDSVARLGGDEFVVLLEDLGQDPREAATQAETVAHKILLALKQPSQFGSYEHHGSASLGITLFGDRPESTVEPLKRADLAMYQAKAAGRNTLRFFDPQMQSMVSARVAMETSLRTALLANQFLLHYQAQVKNTGQIIGVEALVRWYCPERGLVAPAEFIPLAEETGLILPLGRWVLETACTQLAHWASQPARAHLTVSVNVSARQFRQDNFVAQVMEVIEHTGAPARQLKLELTESLLVTQMDDVIAKMGALKSLGVGFSLDDFGTGFSSLSYLKRLPLDQLKIDQGFVRDILIDPNDAAIAGMVVALGNSLGLTVIAEGVETESQRIALADLGCTCYQGYLFSQPLPIEALETFFNTAGTA